MQLLRGVERPCQEALGNRDWISCLGHRGDYAARALDLAGDAYDRNGQNAAGSKRKSARDYLSPAG